MLQNTELKVPSKRLQKCLNKLHAKSQTLADKICTWWVMALITSWVIYSTTARQDLGMGGTTKTRKLVGFPEGSISERWISLRVNKVYTHSRALAMYMKDIITDEALTSCIYIQQRLWSQWCSHCTKFHQRENTSLLPKVTPLNKTTEALKRTNLICLE